MAIYLMDKTYRIITSGGAPSRRVVVAGSVSGQCQLPGGANASKILGVTVTSQSELGRGISVRKAGVAEVVAAGPIAPGSPVNVADSSGRVKAVNEAAGARVSCLGYAETAAMQAGDVIDVFLSIHEHSL